MNSLRLVFRGVIGLLALYLLGFYFCASVGVLKIVDINTRGSSRTKPAELHRLNRQWLSARTFPVEPVSAPSRFVV